MTSSIPLEHESFQSKFIFPMDGSLRFQVIVDMGVMTKKGRQEIIDLKKMPENFAATCTEIYIICTELCGLKYSYLIQTIFKHRDTTTPCP